MQSASINKYLIKLEKNLLRIEEFQKKGCPIESSMGDIYLELRNVGAYLKQAQAEEKSIINHELADTFERYKKLLLKFESVADEVQSQDERMVVASDKALPQLFARIIKRCPGFWKNFERLASGFGFGMVGLTIIGPTYYLAAGKVPFMQYYQVEMSAVNALVFVVGVIVGLCVHEFAHGIVLANNGIGIKRIGAMAGSMVGGFVEAEENSFFQADPRVHWRFNAAGIGTNALLGVILAVVGLLTSSQEFLFLALGNLFFGFINSYPISPLDGGWVYGDLIKLYINSKKVNNIFMALPLVIFVLWISLFIRFALL